MEKVNYLSEEELIYIGRQIGEAFVAEKHDRLMADAMIKHHPKAKIDEKFIHWLAHE